MIITVINMKKYIIAALLLLPFMPMMAQKTYYYTVTYNNLNIGYCYIDYAKSLKCKSDSIVIQVLGDHTPRNKAKVVWVWGGDTIISRTNAKGELSIKRDVKQIYSTVSVQITPDGGMYLPTKYFLHLWDWGRGKRVPVRITFMLENFNPFEIRINSNHPLNSSDIEYIRDTILYSKRDNPPEFDGIKYEVVYER